MTDPKPCPCTLTEAPQHVHGSFDLIEWALRHLNAAGRDCVTPRESEDWIYSDAYHNSGIRYTATDVIRSNVAVHREIFSTILGEVDSESEIAQMIRELGVE
jgi:hypothetical protein